jgi:hypothetical protein
VLFGVVLYSGVWVRAVKEAVLALADKVAVGGLEVLMEASEGAE